MTIKRLPIDGVTVEYNACGHCGADPSEQEIREEVSWWSQLSCSICGEDFKVTALSPEARSRTRRTHL